MCKTPVLYGVGLAIYSHVRFCKALETEPMHAVSCYCMFTQEKPPQYELHLGGP